MNRPNKGFTLMELLIVIGVLGILAAGLLAAIDPFEQLKKARDTNNRSAAIELLGSSQRYYATHGYLPWFKKTGVDFDVNCPQTTWGVIRDVEAAYPHSAIAITPELASGDVYTCLDTTLKTDGEIKGTFFSGLRTNLYIQSGSMTRSAVCFSPEGKSNRSDSSTKYLIDAAGTSISEAAAGVCPDVANPSCLQCFE